MDPSEVYPHVYDSLAKIKQSSSFVAGSKVRSQGYWYLLVHCPYCYYSSHHIFQVAIPEAAERYSDRLMEEIRIPHTSAPPPPVGDERIIIRELDDVAQLAFKGMKELNRIQSIVFDAAYYTNENLLISAPTGAGKTNIAMLCVLREIKNNIHPESGVIQRDKFKVSISK